MPGVGSKNETDASVKPSNNKNETDASARSSNNKNETDVTGNTVLLCNYTDEFCERRTVLTGGKFSSVSMVLDGDQAGEDTAAEKGGNKLAFV